jgi:hypothetical protein
MNQWRSRLVVWTIDRSTDGVALLFASWPSADISNFILHIKARVVVYFKEFTAVSMLGNKKRTISISFLMISMLRYWAKIVRHLENYSQILFVFVCGLF